MLVGLFLVLKYLGKEWINWLLSLYFALVGLYSVPRVTPSPFSHSFSSKVDRAFFQSLVSLAKFTLGRQRWNRFSRSTLKVELMSRRESRSSFPPRTGLISTRGYEYLV
jgi:minor histocompatibility antigen H13